MSLAIRSTRPKTAIPTGTKKDSPKWTFGANDTINGWTNVLLKYTITPHNIYAFARLNSYFAPLTTKEFDTPITLNEATLSRLGLGSYNSLGYISIGSFTFDAMPLTSDLYFGDDAELSAVAGEAGDRHRPRNRRF